MDYEKVERLHQQVADQILPAFRAAGLERVTIHYDGGNDECHANANLSAEEAQKVLSHITVPQELLDHELERLAKYEWVKPEGKTPEAAKAAILQGALYDWAFRVAEHHARDVEFEPGHGSVEFDVRTGRLDESTHHGERTSYTSF